MYSFVVYHRTDRIVALPQRSCPTAPSTRRWIPVRSPAAFRRAGNITRSYPIIEVKRRPRSGGSCGAAPRPWAEWVRDHPDEQL